jgi:predicted homoserine dehydrogenase-like protein
MNKLKRTLIIGAGVASIGVAGLATVASTSAMSGTDNSNGTSLIDNLVGKFHLNKTKVQAVFDADRTEHQESMKANQAAALKSALSSGKITQVQYDYIVKAQAEIDVLRGTSGTPENESQATKDAIKAKMDALRDWMKSQNLTPQTLGLGHGRGGPGHDKDSDDSAPKN